MKHTSVSVSAFLLLALPSLAGAAGTELTPGQLVKARTSSSVYYVDSDLRRYAFPNERVFKSWYPDFGGIVTVDESDLTSYPIGGTVPYKAAKRLVKLQSDPKVYAVDDGGVLRWVKTEEVAKSLFGNEWNTLVDDLSDAFFTSYQLGAEVAADADFDKEKHLKIKDVMQTLREARLAVLTARNASADDKANEGYGKDKKAVCHKIGTEAEVTVYLPDAAVAAHVGHGDAERACGTQAPTDPAKDETKPVISAAVISDITASGATVSLKTNEDATIKAYYADTTPVNVGTANSHSVTAAGKEHSFVLSALQAGTTYHLVITAKDAAGNEATLEEKTFTTLATGGSADTTSPTVSASSIDGITSTGATVRLTANENVTAVVSYGTATPVSVSSAAHADSTTADDSHAVSLTGLTPATTYYVVITATDAAGNRTTVEEKTFVTANAS